MIVDLETELRQLAANGSKELKLSEDVRDKYIDAINEFRTALQGRLDTINALEGIGDPGGLGSAQQTKANLQRQGNAFKYSIQEYMGYLDSLADTVEKAAKRLVESG